MTDEQKPLFNWYADYRPYNELKEEIERLGATPAAEFASQMPDAESKKRVIDFALARGFEREGDVLFTFRSLCPGLEGARGVHTYLALHPEDELLLTVGAYVGDGD